MAEAMVTPAFICSPLPFDMTRRFRRYTDNALLHSSCVLHGCSTLGVTRTQVSSRMRNRGGFQLPPRVPEDAHQRRRAIELLGNLTQRKNMKDAKKREIEALVGGLPKSREIAQQWKVAMEHTPNARLKHLSNPHAFRHRKEVLRRIQLPEQNASTGRSFILLGCLERRYRYSQPPSIRVQEELQRRIGAYPVNVDEAHHFQKALKALQQERRSRELRPPRIPFESMEKLIYAKMALGYYAMRPPKGLRAARAMRLEDVIGTIPRDRNVARSWKKIISAAIRKKKRRDRLAERCAEINRKRLERRLRRERREMESSVRSEAPERGVYNGAALHTGKHVVVGCEPSESLGQNDKATADITHSSAQSRKDAAGSKKGDSGRCGASHDMTARKGIEPLIRRLQKFFFVLLGRKH